MSDNKKRLKFKLLVILVCIFVLIFPINYLVTNYKSDIKYFFTGNYLDYKEVVKNIYLNGNELAYDNETGTYYYSLNNNQKILDLEFELETYHGKNNTLSFENYGVEKKYNNINIEYNKQYNIIINNDGKEYAKKLVFTNMPIVKIIVDDNINTSYVSSNISIYDSEYDENSNSYSFESNSQIRLRGTSSAYFPKKSYRIKLLDESYNNSKNSLLGMNKSDKWIAIPLYNDSSKLRDRVCFDVWNEMNSYDIDEKFNIDQKGKFIELFINNEYKGLYQLKEVINEEKLNLKSDGILVKGINYTSINVDNIDKDNIGNYEMKYPSNINDFTKYWEKIIPYLKDYPNLGGKTNSEEEIFNKYYVENLIDYRILVNLFRAGDNYSTKNTYISLDSDDSRVVITPWDLDLTFGYSFVEDYSDSVRAREEVKDSYMTEPVNLFYANADNYNSMVKSRWSDLRKSVITYDNISTIIDNYVIQLKEAGAITREYQKWEQGKNFDVETEKIKIWIKNRIDYLDGYIGGV